MINNEREMRERESIYNDNGGDGFINPSIFFKQVANNQRKTENGDEQRQGDDRGVIAADVFHRFENSHFCFVVSRHCTKRHRFCRAMEWSWVRYRNPRWHVCKYSSIAPHVFRTQLSYHTTTLQNHNPSCEPLILSHRYTY